MGVRSPNNRLISKGHALLVEGELSKECISELVGRRNRLMSSKVLVLPCFDLHLEEVRNTP